MKLSVTTTPGNLGVYTTYGNFLSVHRRISGSFGHPRFSVAVSDHLLLSTGRRPVCAWRRPAVARVKRQPLAQRVLCPVQKLLIESHHNALYKVLDVHSVRLLCRFCCASSPGGDCRLLFLALPQRFILPKKIKGRDTPSKPARSTAARTDLVVEQSMAYYMSCHRYIKWCLSRLQLFCVTRPCDVLSSVCCLGNAPGGKPCTDILVATAMGRSDHQTPNSPLS